MATGDFDLARNAMDATVVLFHRFYANEALRTKAEEQIKTMWAPTPIIVRVEVLLDLGEVAADHGDSEKALKLADEAKAIIDSYRWTAEQMVPMLADVAGVRALAGDLAGARRLAEDAMTVYETKRETILTTRRNEALIAVAEAYQAMGDEASSLETYAKALEVGASNPNLRPRAEDFCILCLSMALHGVEPDATLWARIRQVNKGLGSQ
jgi:tetratricopeptide (TPR) repeat protein